VIVDVATNLETLRPEQYLLAFAFLGSYAFALGHLLDSRGRAVSAGIAFVAAAAFVACCDPWEQGVMLVALALVGMGAFSATAWVFWTVITWREERAIRTALEAAPLPQPAAAAVPAGGPLRLLVRSS
jgi:hypothetical protein